MDQEEIRQKAYDSLKAKLDEARELFTRNKDTFHAMGCTLVLSLFVVDTPGYLSAQGDKVRLLQNVIGMTDRLKEDVWKHDSKK